MLRIYDLKNQQMLTKPDFGKLTEGFVSFRGVSFVGSFKVIEQELLPRFQQVKLILGMEDRQTGQKMEQIFSPAAGRGTGECQRYVLTTN